MSLLSQLLASQSVSYGTSKDHSATKIFHPLCTFPVSATTYELPIKRNRRMIEFSENGTLCKTKTLPGFDRKWVGHFGDLPVQSFRVFDWNSELRPFII